MGESNAVINRRAKLSPDTLLAAAEIYKRERMVFLRGRPSIYAQADLCLLLATELHGLEDGSIPATFQIMHMVRPFLVSVLGITMQALISRFVCQIGWKPSPNQQAPAKRGSGKVSLKDVLGPEGTGAPPESS